MKVSVSQKSDYTDYGGALPNTGSLAAGTRVCFVLKTPGSTTPASAAYTAVYSGANFFYGSTPTAAGGPEFFNSTENEPLKFVYASDSYSQVISTTTKQW